MASGCGGVAAWHLVGRPAPLLLVVRAELGRERSHCATQALGRCVVDEARPHGGCGWGGWARSGGGAAWGVGGVGAAVGGACAACGRACCRLPGGLREGAGCWGGRVLVERRRAYWAVARYGRRRLPALHRRPSRATGSY